VNGPALVACSHGTADAAGSTAVSGLVDAVRRAADRPVVEAFVDVHGPSVDEVVNGLGGHVVVVPLLLAAGFHVRVDIGRAVAPWHSAATSGTLGPDARITRVLLDRMATAGVRPGDAVVLAAAGSSDDAADESVRSAARQLALAWRAPVSVAYGAAREPCVAAEVARVRAAEPGRRVALVSYLLATGHFHSRVLDGGADLVTAPLLNEGAPDARLVELVLDRFASQSSNPLSAGALVR
jgi:sirohydrochlorin ferrochelatase